MMLRKSIIGLMVLTLVGIVLIDQLQSQQRGPQGQRGQGFQRGNFDPAQMQQMRMERYRQALQATDQQWSQIAPRLTKVTEIQDQSRGARFRGGMMGGRGGRGMGMGGPGQGQGRGPAAGQGRGPGQGQQGQGRDPAAGQGQGRGQRGQGRGAIDQRPPTEIQQKMEALNVLLQNPNANPQQIKTALTDLRTAKEKARKNLLAAQKTLAEVLNPRQEATMVVMGVLE